MMKKNTTTTLIMLFLAFFHAACSATPARVNSTLVIPPTDAGSNILVEPDVVLLGLPDSAPRDTFTHDSQPILTLGTGTNGEIVTPLPVGTRAPYNGVLLNGSAVARISVEFRSQQDRCLIEQNRAVSLVEARYVADTASLRLVADTQRRTDQVIINGLDADIGRLNRLLETQQREASRPHVLEGLAWAGGGLVLGALIVGGVVLATTPRP